MTAADRAAKIHRSRGERSLLIRVEFGYDSETRGLAEVRVRRTSPGAALVGRSGTLPAGY